MVKDCSSCIHNRVCEHKELNPKFKEEMRGLIEKWGNIYSEDCPEWHGKEIPMLKFKEMSESERDEIIKKWNEQERIQPWINTKTSVTSYPKSEYDLELDTKVMNDIKKTCEEKKKLIRDLLNKESDGRKIAIELKDTIKKADKITIDEEYAKAVNDMVKMLRNENIKY